MDKEPGLIKGLMVWRARAATVMAMEEADRRNVIIQQLKVRMPQITEKLVNDESLNHLLSYGETFIGYNRSNLSTYGVANVTDLNRRLRALRIAWAGVVRVVVEQPDNRIRVRLIAV